MSGFNPEKMSRIFSKKNNLERSLVMGLSVIEIKEDDCHTDSYLTTTIINEKHKETLINKWYKLNETDPEWILMKDTKHLNVGQEIYVRSPIFCQTPKRKICKKCWGDKETDTKYLGILAGQILAERLINGRL